MHFNKFSVTKRRIDVLKVKNIWNSRRYGLMKRRHLYSRSIFGWILSMRVNSSSKHGFYVVGFLLTQWSKDESTSFEPMGEFITSFVSISTDNHTLDDRNHQRHRRTLMQSETFITAHKGFRVDKNKCLECTESLCSGNWT